MTPRLYTFVFVLRLFFKNDLLSWELSINFTCWAKLVSFSTAFQIAFLLHLVFACSLLGCHSPFSFLLTEWKTLRLLHAFGGINSDFSWWSFKWIIFPCHMMNGSVYKSLPWGGRQEMGKGKVKISGWGWWTTCLFRREGGAAWRRLFCMKYLSKELLLGKNSIVNLCSENK